MKHQIILKHKIYKLNLPNRITDNSNLMLD